MTPTRDDIILLIQNQAGKLQYVTRPENSLRLAYLREQAIRLIELIDAAPPKDRDNYNGMESGE